MTMTRAPNFNSLQVGDLLSWLQWSGAREHVYRTYALVIGNRVEASAYTNAHIPIFPLCPRMKAQHCDIFDSRVFMEWRNDRAKDLFVVRDGEKLGWENDWNKTKL